MQTGKQRVTGFSCVLLLLAQAALACLSAVLTSVAPRQRCVENDLRPESDYCSQPSWQASAVHEPDEPVYNTSLRLSELMEPLLPSLLSCLEDDGQPDTRSLTASILGQLFELLREALGSHQQAHTDITNRLGVVTGAEAPGGVVSCKGKSHQQNSGTCSSPSTLSYVPPAQQREYLALCSSLYAALLQRLDDARSCVRVSAARALSCMLAFLKELKFRSRGMHSLQADTPTEATTGKSLGTSQRPRRVKVIEPGTQKGEALEEKPPNRKDESGGSHDTDEPVGETTEADGLAAPKPQEKAPGNHHEPSWSWQCLEFVVKGLMTFIDDKDEELAGVVAEAAQLAGELNPDLLRRVTSVTTWDASA